MFWSLFFRSLLTIIVILAIGQIIYSVYYRGKKNRFDDDDE